MRYSKLTVVLRAAGLLASCPPSISDYTKAGLAKKAALALRIMPALGGFFLAATLFGCASQEDRVRKYNEELVQREYDRAQEQCWKLFYRIDPERKKEYQDCMKKKGWAIK